MSLSPQKKTRQPWPLRKNVLNRAPRSIGSKLHFHTWHLRNDHDLVDSVHVSVLGWYVCVCGKTGKDAEKSMKVKMDLEKSLRQKQKHQTPNTLPTQTRGDSFWSGVKFLKGPFGGGFPLFFTYSFRPDLDTRLKSGVNVFDSNIYQCVFGEVKSSRKAWQDGASWGNLLYFRNVLGGDSKLSQHRPTHIHLSFGNSFWIPLRL